MQWHVLLQAATEHQHSLPPDPAGGSFFSDLLQVYVPRQECMFYQNEVIWLHAASDALIAIAYFSIPVALVAFVRRRSDLEFSWMYVLFALFILACGTTHAFGVLDIWRPYYKVDGIIKAFTAIVSVAAAVLIWPLLPRALALPSPSAMHRVNVQLRQQVAERERAEEALRELANELERRVQQRTAELEQANQVLLAEIAARKAAEEERNHLLESERAARTAAERASRMKDEFLATLSHELRTPLNAILGWSQVLRTGERTDEDISQGLEIIERNARVQTQLIEDLLDMSRIISGKLRLDLQTLNLTQVVENVLEAVQPAAEAKDIHLSRSTDPQGAVIRGDPARLQQVAWNLLSNAIKFTSRGGRVDVRLARTGSHVEISVRDTGKGIAPEFMPYIFDRFRQADASTTREHGGLGLGLAIVKHLVEIHGGTVQARSEGEGRGATFIVAIPLVTVGPREDESTHPRTQSMPPDAAEAGRLSLKGVHVLAVDDEPDARQLLRRVLEEHEANVSLAASAAEALELLEQRRPDVLISDIGMPEKDGYELIRRIRNLPPEKGGGIPAAALTAFARSEDRTRSLLAGYQMHIPKPLEPSELVAVVASLARRTEGAPPDDHGSDRS